MSRYVKLVLILLSVSVSTTFQVNQAASASDIECIRKSNSAAGFVSVRAFDGWFPMTNYFHWSSAELRRTDRLRFAGGYETRAGMRYSLAPRITWEMLAYGRLFGMLGHGAGYVLVTPVRYVCRTCVQKADTNRRIFAQPVGEYASRRSGANDDVIIAVRHARTLFQPLREDNR